MKSAVLPPILNEMPASETILALCNGHFLKAHYTQINAQRIYIRSRLAEAQNWRCCWCGRECTEQRDTPRSMTIEHIIPRSLGGTDNWENLAMACRKCNTKRGSEMTYNNIELQLVA